MTLEPGRIQVVFLAALEQETLDGRIALLDRECAGDEGLRLRVEALLIAHDRPDSPLDRPFIPLGEQVRPTTVQAAAGANGSKSSPREAEPTP